MSAIGTREQLDSIRTELLMIRIRTEETEEKLADECGDIRRQIARALDKLETIEEELPAEGLDST
jgi:hypothetical protein